MNERQFRLLLGVILWCILMYTAYFENMNAIYIFTAYLLFEGITNLRFTVLSTRMLKGVDITALEDYQCGMNWFHKIEAERILRIIVAVFVIGSYYIFPDLLWFMPWFVAGMLILAGITNICPMVMFLKWAGLR